jgi:hypothetical protein
MKTVILQTGFRDSEPACKEALAARLFGGHL